MNVQELIDQLQGIKNKDLPVQLSILDEDSDRDSHAVYGAIEYVDWTGRPDKPVVVWINGYVT